MTHIIPAVSLPQNWSAVVARIKAGEHVLIDLGDQAVAEIALRPAAPRPARAPGALKGRVRMTEDFDSWPEDLRQAWGMDPA